jgi:probable HAF family extracellular repeat protein
MPAVFRTILTVLLMPARRCLTAAGLIAIAAMPATAPAQVLYSVNDLGTLGGTFSEAYGINGAGQVVGRSPLAGDPNAVHAFRSSPAGQTLGLTDLGTLGGMFSYGFGINGAGQVTGVSLLSSGPFHAFRTTATGRISDPGTDLGAFGSSANSQGNAINSSGQVTGWSGVGTGTALHAFRTAATGRVSDPGTDLGVFSGGTRSFGQAINDAGQVAGYSEYAPPSPPNPTGPARAFRTTATGLVSDPGAELGTLGGSQSQAFGINNAGQVVGQSYTTTDLPDHAHAFRSSPNGQPVSLTDLGTLGGTLSAGLAINSLGVVVGNSTIIPGNFGTHAFIYDTQMRDLNLLIAPGSGWMLGTATGINDAGQITSVGVIGGQTHAYLLTPVAVPEPGGLLLAGAAATTWLLRRRIAVTAYVSSHPGAWQI